MIFTAMLTLEVNQWFPAGTEFVTMLKELLGPYGSFILCTLYLLFFYVAITNYYSGIGNFIIHSLHLHLPIWMGCLPWIILAGLLCFYGPHSVVYFYRVLLLGLVLSLSLIVIFSVRHIHWIQLGTGHYAHLFYLFPFMVGAFTFHFMIPTLRTYLNNDTKLLNRSFLYSAVLLLLIYGLWLMLNFGIFPTTGANSLAELRSSTFPTLSLIEQLTNITVTPILPTLFKIISFCTITISFMGMTLAMHTFIKELFHLSSSKKDQFITTLNSLLPPLIFIVLSSNTFESSYMFNSVLIFVIFILTPILLVWRGRYIKKLAFGFSAGGNKVILLALIALVLLVFYHILGK